MLSWLSPPDWKSYKATNKLGSSSFCASRFSFDIHFVFRKSPRGDGGRGRVVKVGVSEGQQKVRLNQHEKFGINIYTAFIFFQLQGNTFMYFQVFKLVHCPYDYLTGNIKEHLFFYYQIQLT